MNTTVEQLKPCPFCESIAISVIKTRFRKGFNHYGYCNDCHTCGPQKSSRDWASAAWDTRFAEQSEVQDA